MLDYLALSLPGNQNIDAPNSVPTGGLDVVQKVVGNSLGIMMIIAIILAIAFVVWSGVQWAGSSGDKGKIAAAESRLTWSIIGLIIVILTFFILNFVGYLFKVNLLKIQ